MRGMTIWAVDDDRRKHFTVVGYVWPQGSDKILDLNFFVQHVVCMDEYDAKALGISQARKHLNLGDQAPGVAFGVFAGHLEELTWTAFVPPAKGNARN